jgi:hypothetical protein
MIIDTFRKPVDYNKMKPQPAANQTQTNKPVQQVQVTPPVQFQIPQSAPYQQQYQQIPMQFQQQYQQVPMQVPMQLQQ